MRLKKRFIWPLLLAAAAILAWRFGYQAALKYFFMVSGTVTVEESLLKDIPGSNGMLFVIAKNDGGVPIAVNKIINPVFPAEFQLTPSSLIMPDLLTRRIYLEALLNTHGKLGEMRRGDMRGEKRESSHFISQGQEIEISARIK